MKQNLTLKAILKRLTGPSVVCSSHVFPVCDQIFDFVVDFSFCKRLFGLKPSNQGLAIQAAYEGLYLAVLPNLPKKPREVK